MSNFINSALVVDKTLLKGDLPLSKSDMGVPNLTG